MIPGMWTYTIIRRSSLIHPFKRVQQYTMGPIAPPRKEIVVGVHKEGMMEETRLVRDAPRHEYVTHVGRLVPLLCYRRHRHGNVLVCAAFPSHKTARLIHLRRRIMKL